MLSCDQKDRICEYSQTYFQVLDFLISLKAQTQALRTELYSKEKNVTLFGPSLSYSGCFFLEKPWAEETKSGFDMLVLKVISEIPHFI